MAFDSQRGVMVLFGAGRSDGSNQSETWEYKMTSLGNGEGCTAVTATSCASGFCVDGVCCAVASCSGVCQSCAVAGHESTCSQATAGAEIPGSCADGQACDGSGNCKAKNGTVCSGASVCASGFCVDGVCCESACTGRCLSCNQPNRAGKCSPYALGSDPEKECGLGSSLCRSTCNGAGACDHSQYGSICGSCQICDGAGLCFDADPSECGTGSGGGAGAGGTLFGGVGGGGGAAGSSGSSSISPDGGLIQPDAASPDGRKPAPPPDATSTTQPRRQGCSCDSGQTAAGTPGIPFALLGIALLWRRRCRSR